MEKGSFTLEKGTLSRWPRETRSPENVSRVRELIEENPRLRTYKKAAKLSLPQTSILKILTDDLQFKNVLSVWVPHQLTDSNNARSHSAHDTQAFLAHRVIQLVKQPAYSPDLNLYDRYLFRKTKHRLKGYDFGGIEVVKDCMQRVVR